MGTYLNPGKEAFEKAVKSDIFVDKTEMILYLNSVVNTKQQYISVSRPRRFGKSMTADMICAYYDREADSRSLFEHCKLAGTEPIKKGQTEILWDSFLGKFNVIYLTMTDFINSDRSVDEGMKLITKRVLLDLEEMYPDVKYDPDDLFYSMDRFYRKSGIPFVVIIDEWDAVFRVHKYDTKGQTKYLDFLRNWLKDKAYIALAYMTGILPIKKYGKHSALNMFDEYSMMNPMQLAPYTGFLTSEVEELTIKYGRDLDRIKDWYDGYRVSDIIPPDPDHEILRETGKSPEGKKYDLYSPLSVVKSVTTGRISNYWNKTETYEALAEYIRKDYDGLKDSVAFLMDGGKLKIDTSTYQNDMTTFTCRDDVLSLLIHLGYLGFDDETSEVFIPNKEILDEFRTSTKSDEWIPTFRSFEMSQELLKATWNEDADKVADIIERMHDKADNRTYNDEAALSYAIRMAYYSAQKYYTLIPETDSGKGYADLICIPSPKYADKPAMVVELKYNKDAEGAIAQIRNRNYPERLEHYKDNILLVGINYDKDVPNTDPQFKHHSCVIEKA
ncbi:MAG: AAA family ATPase [Oscillospiraceae bacterium]|nr:AAA family ATPase [Oscillospiraceae bacterium]MBR6837813.1 AAA family ATPase [Oscillospiraceae bacterium]